MQNQLKNIVLKRNTWDLNQDGKLQIAGSGAFSQYTDEMTALNNLYRTKNPNLAGNRQVLFAVNAADEANTNLAGDMPLASQFGYLICENITADNIARTAAHEITHGLFQLRHIWENGLDKGSTDNLMDYTSGTHLMKFQWDEMFDKKDILFPEFQGEDVGKAEFKNEILDYPPFFKDEILQQIAKGNIERNLIIGQRGNHILIIQKALNYIHFKDYEISENDEYDMEAVLVIKEFQKRFDLAQSGVIDKNTLLEMDDYISMIGYSYKNTPKDLRDEDLKRPATEDERNFWLTANSKVNKSIVSNKLLLNYLSGLGKEICLNEDELEFCEPKIDLNKSEGFRLFLETFILTHDTKTRNYYFRSFAFTPPGGTLGKCTAYIDGTFLCESQQSYYFEGYVSLYDYWDFNLENRNNISELKVKTIHYFCPGLPFSVRTTSVPIIIRISLYDVPPTFETTILGRTI